MEIKFFNKQTLLEANGEALKAHHTLKNVSQKVNYLNSDELLDLENDLLFAIVNVEQKDPNTVTVSVVLRQEELTENQCGLLDINTQTFENLPVAVIDKLDS